MSVPKTRLDDIAAQLRELEGPSMSLQRLVESLLEDIEGAQQRGLPLRKIATLLGEGQDIAPTSLANCLARARAKRRHGSLPGSKVPQKTLTARPVLAEHRPPLGAQLDAPPRDGSFTPRADRGDI